MNAYCRKIDVPNPFCTRRVRPGAIDYIFAEGESAGGLVERLQANRWRGEITGPHGSGKSALLSALIPEIRRAGKTPVLVELRDRQRRLPISLRQLLIPCNSQNNSGAAADLSGSGETTAQPLLVIDGYEQFGLWARVRLMLFRRWHGIGLLVTSHRGVGLPRLYHTSPSPELAARIVQRLLGDSPHEKVPFASIQSAFHHRGGNIREVLFDLYDLLEKRRRGKQP